MILAKKALLSFNGNNQHFLYWSSPKGDYSQLQQSTYNFLNPRIISINPVTSKAFISLKNANQIWTNQITGKFLISSILHSKPYTGFCQGDL